MIEGVSMPDFFSKEQLIHMLHEIQHMGWIKNKRPGNAGGVGNTLEDLLGINENNLPIPNASEWELKCHRRNSESLSTLFHSEPSPRALKIVPSMLLPGYGWSHTLAGTKYPLSEMSFRQTISGLKSSDRGFKVTIDRGQAKIAVSFNSRAVDPRHEEWLSAVNKRVGLGELNPQPYWGFTDIFHKAGTKILNTFFVIADVQKDEQGNEYFNYSTIEKLTNFSIEGFINAIESGHLFIDFDARTGHNHGTKFRIKERDLPLLYECIEIV